ncbi:TNT domain-containing protein [Yoonia sp. 2307UL14-13]|uniref:TNT domain-containing protein n=1 Tax=Yoonia sp. 2307UL14-13 TaxID=3126506 RepID=UPI00309FA9F4
MEQDDPNNPAGLQQGLAAADAQPSGDVGQVCEACPNNWVEAGAIDETTGEPLPGLGYRIYDMASGDQVASGILDEKGESPRHQIDMPITQLYVIFGTEEAMDAAEDQIGEKQREHALEQNAVSEWRGIPAGLDEGEFNQAYDRIAYEAGRYEKPSVGLFEGIGYGYKFIWDYVSSGFDSSHAQHEIYLDDRRRNFEEYQLATNAREASDAESFFGGGGQGLTFGFGEEGMARLDSLFSDRSYDELVAERRQLNRAQQIANPNWYIGGEIAGAVPTIFVPVGGAAANAARAGQGIRGAVVAGAKTGAATGALSGAGHDEGGVLDRLDGAALGAATGGLAGAVLSGAGVLIARGVSRTRIWGRIVGRVSPKRAPFHRRDLSDEWYDAETGLLRWPPNDGFDGTVSRTTLPAGARIDRYSRETGLDDTGSFLSPQGANWTSRALPYEKSTQQYAVYEVLRPLEVSSGRAAAWFDEAGGATQYLTDRSVGDLIREGYLRQVIQ